MRLAVFTGGAASKLAVASRGSRRDKIINLCVYLVQKFSGKRNNENFNDFLRMLASPSICRVCACGAGGGRQVGRSSEEKSRLLAKGASSPFPPSSLEIIIAPLTAARFARFYVSLSHLFLSVALSFTLAETVDFVPR